MKNTLITLILTLGITMTALSQIVMQPDSVFMHYSVPSWTTNPVIDSARTTVFTYDNMGLLNNYNDLCGNGYEYHGGTTTQSNYVYDEHRNCISAHIEKYVGVVAIYQDIVYNYQDHLLINEQETCLVDAPPQYGWGTTYITTDYAYDEEGRLIEELKVYSDNIIGTNTRKTYEYGDRLVSETFEAFYSPSGEWRILSQVTKTYSDNGLLLQSLRYLTNDSTRLTSYHYNEQERIIGSTTQKMMNGEFVNEYRALYDLNGEGLPTLIRFEDWDGQGWVPGSSKAPCVRHKIGNSIYLFYFNDLIIFTEDHLKRQHDLLSDRGIEHMELFYTSTPPPAYDISETTETNGITIHPNPTKGQFSVSGMGMTKVEVYNLLGERLVERQCADETTLDLDKQPSGMYLITVTDDQGKQHTQKIIKQ